MSTLLGNKLTWVDNNDFEDGFRVYRSGTSFDKENLPAVYATLPAGSQSYLDTSIVMGQTYFYMVSTFAGDKEVFAPNVERLVVNYIPETVGEDLQGGTYIGNITLGASYGADEGVYAIIMAGIDGQSPSTLRWKVRADDTPAASDLKDGLANTYAMVSAGVNDHPAAAHCINYSGGGYNDWYLPAKDELNLAYVNRFELAAMALPNESFWSSSQVSASNASFQDMSNGYQFSYSKTSTYRVRPVRRLKIQ